MSPKVNPKELGRGSMFQNMYLLLVSLLLHNLPDIPYDKSEHTMVAYVCHKLNEIMPRRFRINPNHISTAHLIKPRNNNNKTPILLIKFTHRWLRNELFYDRHNIRDRNVSITEHLCEYRLYLLREARKTFGYGNVFTDQAQVYRKENDRTFRIRSMKDIRKSRISTDKKE